MSFCAVNNDTLTDIKQYFLYLKMKANFVFILAFFTGPLDSRGY